MSASTMEQKGWHSRGYLPHFDSDRFQFITIHLADSLPQLLLKKFRAERENNKLDHYYDEEFRKRVEEYLDKGIGECILGIQSVASVVENAIRFYNGSRYDLRSWVIMPNHAHILFKPNEGVSLSDIMKNLKGYTAREINKLLAREGTVWHPDYFDTYIRNQTHFNTVVAYIENNPVSAGLCAESSKWLFSSASMECRNMNSN